MAPQSTSSTDGPITLYLQDLTRVAGETLIGCVDLNVALAQEDHLEHLKIWFRGTIHSEITEFYGDTRTYHDQTILLFHIKILLWDRGTAFPKPGSHILSCPFQVLLPENLPPSFHCEGDRCKSTITYSLEVVGDKVGFSRINRVICRIIPVVPAASRSQFLAKQSLRQWNGPWREILRQERLRQGIWGEYSHARVKLTIPDLSAYPIATAIPFSFHVETDTKPMHASDAPVDKHGKQLFPAPPALSSDVRLSLWRKVEVRVRKHTEHVEDYYILRGSLRDMTRTVAVHQVIDKPQWIPSDRKGHGIWRRAIHFKSAVTIPYAPTSRTEIVDWQYKLLFVVPFPGIGNDLRLEIPLHLHPSSPRPPLPVGVPGSSSMAYADVLPAGPPPMFDLPPSYWSSEHHTWDTDRKS